MLPLLMGSIEEEYFANRMIDEFYEEGIECSVQEEKEIEKEALEAFFDNIIASCKEDVEALIAEYRLVNLKH